MYPDIKQVGGAAITLGQKTMANSLPVVLPSNQSAIPVSEGPVGTVLTTYALHSTTNATTTPTSTTSYISVVAISVEVVGTTSTVTIQDKSGTPLKLVPGIVTTATGVTVYNFQTPLKMTSGIDIVTAGAVAATIDVWINYYQ